MLKKTLKIILIFFLFYFLQDSSIYLYLFFYLKNCFKIHMKNSLNQFKLDYENNIFAIIYNKNCRRWGLFAFYRQNLPCINEYLSFGYIPIIDLISTPNIFNKFKVNSSNENPWEYFFNQPFGYTLENVKKNAKNIKYFNCNDNIKILKPDIFNNKPLIYYWHYIAQKYIGVKTEIIKEANIKKEKLFKGSNNILGVLTRGTDYLAKRPYKHPIPPSTKTIFKDIKKLDKINKYDYIFITTEDDIIRNKFIIEFKRKLRYIRPNFNINYNYKEKHFLGENINIKGNIYYMKIYLINILILSKCIDIIAARTSGIIATFILTQGFRNAKLYYLGIYK